MALFRPSLMRSHSRARMQRPLRSACELLEDRTMLAAFVVTNSADSGAGSLRQAILDANANAGLDQIEFDLPANDPGHVYYADDGVDGQITLANVTTTTEADDTNIADIDPDWAHSWWVISPTSALPAITDAVEIDGTTQTGAMANTNAVGQGLNSVLRIELDGSNAGNSFGLQVTGGAGSAIHGVVINRFAQTGVQLDAADNTVTGSFVGTDTSGTQNLGNANGVVITASTNAVGGTAVADRNLISANLGQGVFFSGGSGSLVQGSLIGTDISGTVDLVTRTTGFSLSKVATTLLAEPIPVRGTCFPAIETTASPSPIPRLPDTWSRGTGSGPMSPEPRRLRMEPMEFSPCRPPATSSAERQTWSR